MQVDAVIDASFWINGERSGVLPYLLDFFQLWMPPLVADELRPPSNREGLAVSPSVFTEWVAQGHVQIAAPETSYGRFDAGENQAIALARERGWVLLIDDGQPRHYSRGVLGLHVVDSPAFIVFLYDQGRLSYDDAIRALGRSQAGRRIRREALIALEMLKRREERP